jgi:type II secretion system protein G
MLRPLRSDRPGFTLIELLIVVAIIAILAAIAVPNFLEAQTRSKVSAAKADLRTIALGLESYYVDHNSYPYKESIGAAQNLVPGGFPRNAPPGVRPAGLTSPIAYLTAIPADAFRHVFPPGDPGGIVGVGPYYYERAGLQIIDGVLLRNGPVLVPADTAGTSRLDGIGPDIPVTNPAAVPRAWVLYSLGPDLDLNVPNENGGGFVTQSRYHLANRYDPTNGTISKGNILRFPGGESFP